MKVLVTDVEGVSMDGYHVVRIPDVLTGADDVSRLKEEALRSGLVVVLQFCSLDPFRLSIVFGALKRLVDGQLLSLTIRSPIDISPLLTMTDELEAKALARAIDSGILTLEIGTVG